MIICTPILAYIKYNQREVSLLKHNTFKILLGGGECFSYVKTSISVMNVIHSTSLHLIFALLN